MTLRLANRVQLHGAHVQNADYGPAGTNVQSSTVVTIKTNLVYYKTQSSLIKNFFKIPDNDEIRVFYS